MKPPINPPRIPGHLGEPITPEQSAKRNEYWARHHAWMAKAETEFRESERRASVTDVTEEFVK